ncbi:26S proteasome subunit RPN7-domain-containing protein [Protomyces lactucae-debilis]|uniref:26S proteasome subunit RPN7-domain-containing protein n=1 Tax=Protomyces lactucae-debilis TaxID=2754530 RepID=A0A1Y2FBV4_PROLT|nr:26S proteasome subunit RPN7-domain-containing protein [Protomyces lactucae-debilis]ORY80914.1 26S proteasome subunit RPN7-domain-containing protein [Protomyces lactucae-debilis]
MEIGPEPTWELGAYIQNYKGYIKVKRLVHIANTFDSLRSEALQRALTALKEETMDGETYANLAKLLPESVAYDSTWATEITRKAQAMTVKLESELKAYKNNLIKESIRLGQQDLADHQAKMGQFDEAIKTYIQNRDVCTTPDQVAHTTFKIVELATIAGQWATANTYLSKIDGKLEKGVDRQKSLIAKGLSNLAHGGYHQAATAYISAFSVAQVQAKRWEEVICLNDIANQTVVIALAYFDRKTLSSELLNNSNMTPVLELEGNAREALECFYKSRYADLFKVLEIMRGDLLADMHLEPSAVQHLFSRIKKRSLIQFAKAFKSVSLTRMVNEFGKTPDELEQLLEELIMSDELPNARIDAVRGLLVLEATNATDATMAKTLAMGKQHSEEYARALVHLTITQAGLEIAKPKGEPTTNRQGEAEVMQEDEEHSDPASPMEDLH